MAASDPASAREKAIVERQYDWWARAYDMLWRRYVHRTVPVAESAAGVTAGEQVLDLGTGTGELAGRIAQHTPDAEVVGIDLSRGMIERAREKFGGQAALCFEQADAHDLPFRENRFDVVVSTSTFHYFREPERALEEAARVLRPEGRLVLLDWCRDFWTCQVMDAVLQRIDPAYQTCYTLDELIDLMEAASFKVHHSRRYRFDLVWGMMVVEGTPRTPSSLG